MLVGMLDDLVKARELSVIVGTPEHGRTIGWMEAGDVDQHDVMSFELCCSWLSIDTERFGDMVRVLAWNGAQGALEIFRDTFEEAVSRMLK